MSPPRTLATLEGYAVEGGYDRPGGPTTCFAPSGALGRHGVPGVADELWRDYEDVLDLAATLGLDGVRVTLEWARLAPERDVFDDEAADRYRRALRHARERGLWVSAVLVDRTWPAWAGQEAWLLPWVEPVFARHAQRTIEYFFELVDGFVAFSDADALVRRGFIEGVAPPWRRGAKDDARAASANVARLEAGVRALAPEKMVRDYRVFELDVDTEVLARARGDETLEELHLRSLVRGAGPGASRAGLLARHAGQWRVSAPEELLLVWR
ncbi:MAG TPA: hypothetical protein VMU98_03765 [Acidimicrobiales bacterium]|nr:hypothetical protein [Acidimicrobiales bacterium]